MQNYCIIDFEGFWCYKFNVCIVFGGNCMDELYDLGEDLKGFQYIMCLSYWLNLFGVQFIFIVIIIFCWNDFVFGLGFCIDCRYWVWMLCIVVVVIQVYFIKMLFQLWNFYVFQDWLQCFVEKEYVFICLLYIFKCFLCNLL